ncbi:MAG TPA: hypothetical protein VMV68_04050, partial [Spirochaetia bacterium]|nr:hypothetical protein [Spirochaetia bacterium]
MAERSPFAAAACLCALLLALFGPAPASAQDRVMLAAPVVSPDTPSTRRQLEQIVHRAVFAVNTLYGASLRIEPSGYSGPAQYRLQISANDASPGRAFAITLSPTADPGKEQSYAFLSDWSGDFGRVVGQAIYYLHEAETGFSSFTQESPPVYVDTLRPSMLSSAGLPYSIPLRSYSVSVAPKGGIVVGTAIAAVELDPLYRRLGEPGKELLDSGVTSYAYQVFETPAGTLISRPVSGSELYVIHPGETRAVRLRTGVDQPSAIAVLDDGSVVVVDSLRHKAYRLSGQKTTQLPIFPYPELFVSAVSSGPDDTLWVWDPVEGRLRIYDSEGQLEGSIIPMLAKEARGGMKALKALPDGSFLLLGQSGLFRFDRLGNPLWALSEIPAPEVGAFTFMNSLEYDATTGFIYLVNYSSGEVVRLLDREPPKGAAAPNELTRKILAMNARLAAHPDDPALYRDKAKLYEGAGAYELAKAEWDHVLDLAPNDREAEGSAQAIGAVILKAQAERAASRALDLLRRIGIENARASYVTAVKLYEQVIAAAPGDSSARSELDQLKRAFQAGAQPPNANRQLEIVTNELPSLFPALLTYYRSHAVGSVEVKNVGNETLRNIRLSVSMRYLDYPSQSPAVAELAPGASTEIPVFIPLSSDVMSLEEDLPVQLLLDATYEAGSTSDEVTRVVTDTLYRNTALTWENTDKFAAFITPHDNLISRFALELLATPASADESSVDRLHLTVKFRRAIQLVDALGAYGMHYIEDPASPFTKVFGEPEAVDTVRFPRTTLRVHSGDCDDTTALLASVLEASAVHTAIMTSPGHIFLAFDSEARASEAWMFQARGFRTIIHNGTLWIPIETTVLTSGFTAAWRDASQLVST